MSDIQAQISLCASKSSYIVKKTYINAQGVFLLMHKYLIEGITQASQNNWPSINHSHVILKNQLTT